MPAASRRRFTKGDEGSRIEGRGEEQEVRIHILFPKIRENLDEAGRPVKAQLSKREASGFARS